MKKTVLILGGFILFFALGSFVNKINNSNFNKTVENLEVKSDTIQEKSMKIGTFSVSLSVKDLKVSKAFYEKLGFTSFGGNMEQNYLIMKNENTVIGLFQDMFEGNILTFNPGWDENANEIEDFVDVREIQKALKNKGVDIGTEIEASSSGPASFMVTDPDGNSILFDQHR